MWACAYSNVVLVRGLIANSGLSFSLPLPCLTVFRRLTSPGNILGSLAEICMSPNPSTGHDCSREIWLRWDAEIDDMWSRVGGCEGLPVILLVF